MNENRSRMRKWLLIATGLVVGLVLFGLGVALVSGSSRPRMPEVRLSDGRLVQLAAVTTGQTHTVHSPKLRTMMFRFMPDGFRRQMGPSFNSSFGFRHNGIALWLLCYDPVLGKYVTGAFDKLVIVDDHGCELESAESGGTSDGFHHAAVISVANFPRNREKLTFRIVSTFGGTNILGEMTIDNPIKAERANWEPQALPISVTNAGVIARLNRIPAVKAWVDLEIFERGVPSKDWSLQDMYYQDPFGNAGHKLCRKEKAWKLKTRFVRRPTATFASNEVWRVGTMTVPAAGAVQALSASNTVAGVPMTLRYFLGPGSYTLSNGVCTAAIPWTNGMNTIFSVTGRERRGKYVPITTRASNWPLLVISHESLYPERFFMARFKDGDRVVASAEGVSSDGANYYYELSWQVPPQEIPATNTPLEMEIIVQEGREFEFLVDPRDYQTDAPI